MAQSTTGDGTRSSEEKRSSVVAQSSDAEKRGARKLVGTSLLLGLSFACIAGGHAPLIGYKTYANVDEAYALALAQRILDGHKLYEGAISQRGPLMYYAYAFIAKTVGWDNIVGLRLYALAFALLHAGLAYWAGSKLLSRRGAIFATLIITYALGLGIPPVDRMALNGEFLQVPAVIAGATLGIIAVTRTGVAQALRPRRWLLFFAGFFTGMAISIKQSAALHILPIALGVLFAGWRTKLTTKQILGDFVFLGVGFVILPMLFIVHAWREGTLDAMLFYTAKYNVQTHLGEAGAWRTPFSFEFRGNNGFVISIVVVLLHRLIMLRREKKAVAKTPFLARLRDRATKTTMGDYLFLQLVIGIASAATMRRFFPHYFILTMPFLALTLGHVFHDLTRRTKRPTLKSIFGVLLGMLVFTSIIEAYVLEKIDGLVTHDKVVRRISHYIELTTSPNDKIFVWGFQPWYYGYAHRRPAGRYVFETYVTGVVPWNHEDPEKELKRIVPGSTEALLDDLEREKPVLIIDAGSVMLARNMTAFEKPAAYLRSHYCFELRIRAHDIYRRRGDAPCKDDRFPQPSRARDFAGHVIDVPMPPSVAAPPVEWLNVMDDRLPAWFVPPADATGAGYLLDPVDGKAGRRLDPQIAPVFPGTKAIKD